jgi:hypothetical protein
MNPLPSTEPFDLSNIPASESTHKVESKTARH